MGALVLFLGCSYRHAASVQGRWSAAFNTCTVDMDISGLSFSESIVCAADNGGVETQADVGTFSIDDKAIYITVTKSTCYDSRKSYQFSYVATPDSLTTTSTTPGDSSAIVYTPNARAKHSGYVTFGCLRKGTFTPSPLAPI